MLYEVITVNIGQSIIPQIVKLHILPDPGIGCQRFFRNGIRIIILTRISYP